MVPPPLLRRIRLTLVGLGVTLAAILWVATRGAPTETTATDEHVESTIPLTDVAPFGANFFLEHEAEDWAREQTVRMASEAGIRYAKQHFVWAYLEPERGRFAWDEYDEIVDLYRSNGIEVIARLDWPPGWVPKAAWVPESLRDEWNAPPADPEDYGRFVGEVVKHYRGKVRFVQIWNEPNLIAEWGVNPGHPVDPGEYTALLAAASRAAREADPNVVIMAAPLAINTEQVSMAGNMNDLDYLRGMYAAGAAQWFDVLSANAFGMDKPPDDPPAADALNFRRVELQRRIMESNGDADKPIWFVEFGWNAAPPEARAARWRRVTEVEQATWTVDAVRYAQEHWPWAGVFNIWYFRQTGRQHLSTEAVYYFRMVDVDWTPRRVYSTVQQAAASLETSGPGVRAERSAAVQLPTEPADRDLWVWGWAEGARDGNALLSREPGATLTFRFNGTAVEARLETGAQAGAVLVEVDGRQIRAGSGEPGISLKSDRRHWQWLPLASGLPAGPHEMVLTVGAAGGAVAIDAFRVIDTRTAAESRSRAPYLLGLLALMFAVALASDVRQAAHRIEQLESGHRSGAV